MRSPLDKKLPHLFAPVKPLEEYQHCLHTAARSPLLRTLSPPQVTAAPLGALQLSPPDGAPVPPRGPARRREPSLGRLPEAALPTRRCPVPPGRARVAARAPPAPLWCRCLSPPRGEASAPAGTPLSPPANPGRIGSAVLRGQVLPTCPLVGGARSTAPRRSAPVAARRLAAARRGRARREGPDSRRLSPLPVTQLRSASRKPRLRSACLLLDADRPVPLAASLPPSLRPPSSWQGGWESAARLQHMPSLRSRPGPSAINQGASQAPPRLLQLFYGRPHRAAGQRQTGYTRGDTRPNSPPPVLFLRSPASPTPTPPLLQLFSPMPRFRPFPSSPSSTHSSPVTPCALSTIPPLGRAPSSYNPQSSLHHLLSFSYGLLPFSILLSHRFSVTEHM